MSVKSNSITLSNLFSKVSLSNSKKAIGPVVATALLLVVAVVGVVTFQTWFSTYFSQIFTSLETQSDSALNNPLEIERIVGTTLYISNNNQENVSINELRVGKLSCALETNVSPGINQIELSSCIENLSVSTPEIVLVTKNTILTQKVYFESIGSNFTSTTSLTQSDCDAISYGEWVLVPGNSNFNTNNFCVMKYEAKATTASEPNLASSSNMYCGDGADGGGGVRCPTNGSVNITSKAESKPLTRVYQIEARELCKNLGPRFHLITNDEWMSIVRDVESIPSNWADNVVGSLISNGGGLKRGNIGVDDSASYDAALDPADRSLDTNPKAMFTLSNGETIWDISGNVWDITNDTFTDNTQSSLGVGTTNWYDWTVISGYEYLKPSNLSFNSDYGVGRVYADVDDSYSSGSNHSFFRGGRWGNGNNGGAFALALDAGPLHSYSAAGFRCSYS